MKTQKLFLTLFAFLIISWPSFSLATSGCCSYHGGVSHCDTSTGRQVCNDGSYSPSCTCSYIPPVKKTAPPPAPKNPIVAADTKLEYDVIKTGEDKFSVSFDWYYPNETDDKDWSVRLDTKAADPGPLADTHRSKITFSDVKPGNYTLSVKAKILGEWSDYAYWDSIYISDAIAKDKVPTVIEYASQQPFSETKNKTDDDFTALVFLLFLGSGLLNIILFITTMVYRNKSKKIPTQ